MMRSINKGASRQSGIIISSRKLGAYSHIVISVPEIPSLGKPGNFVAVAVGGNQSSMLLHRVFAIYRSRVDSHHGSVIELIVSATGKGSSWLVDQPEGTFLHVTGPLGSSFPLPADPVNVAIVGGGYGAAPLFDLADLLKSKGCKVDAVVGAATSAKVFAPLDGKRTVNSVTVTTEDGSAGVRGRVTDVLDEIINRQKIDLIYSCGPMPMLRAVHRIASAHGVAHQISVEETMACGIGICMTCVLPMDIHGETKLVRSCIEGPVLDGNSIIWDEIEGNRA
jgi:dihydroorotate dehydrogenase electron transfer subunit